ncbi:D-hexose-6-phosphate mutarotase [Gilvimarinus algae]|uniref:Putative glucose-6-phosphate 1-epimerase n=1 Tax=Gilvimarinus algae TaxID=3058037 RepID=A0ABT8TEW2_9GAMM|nr:D-hexose-6-phosphate mutarotase [Gilvimarinus sp. SDUM040014]MDO3382180.1 D-hexose-6-phosphate mutarotase [Gilvimarinus sp. SDUM040014]
MSRHNPSLQRLLAEHEFLSLTDSQSRFADHPGSGLPLLAVSTPLCEALIAFNGAQLLSFKPTGGEELLWVSPNCQFSEGASLRGGIPLCLPWFGPHPSDKSRPNHGIARTRDWHLTGARLDDHQLCHLSFEYTHNADLLFEHDFSATLVLTLGLTPTLSLHLHNRSEETFDASWVMHTYFAVSDIAGVRVEGLDGREYADKVRGGRYFTQSGPITFSGEVDRVFEDIQLPVTIDAGRRLRVTGDNCPSVVVWNTGDQLARKIADIGPGHHTGYVCVERGACLGDSWRLAPGEERHAEMSITPA